jgi:Ribonuclease G/E
VEAVIKAKVRGIYSTALTKMLLENGFEIVQPSLTIKNRFGLSDNSAPPDLVTKDRYDLQGIRVLGTPEAVSKLQSILESSFSDVLTRRWMVSVDGIYKGKLFESNENSVYVDVDGNVVGRLPKSETAGINEEQLIVQVERRRIGTKQPLLTTNLKIVGNHAILAQNSKVGVSLKIRDLTKRAELYALGKMLAPEGWGIIWRESATTLSREKLETEIATLVKKIKVLYERASHAEAPTLLIEGSYFMDVEFPWFSKRGIDKLRASVAPTLEGHHFYKSCGGKVSAALEMAEKLLEKGQGISEVEKSFKEQILGEFPEVGSLVNVEHVKPSGLAFRLGQATIESLDEKQLAYSRMMRSNGFYDGLGVKKEAGDKAVSETKMDDWCITTKYFSNSGKWKGTYINLNTPVEVYPTAIRYVDLEVDICIQPNGTIKVLDMEKLEKTLERGFISKTLFEIIKEKVKTITEALKEDKS